MLKSFAFKSTKTDRILGITTGDDLEIENGVNIPGYGIPTIVNTWDRTIVFRTETYKNTLEQLVMKYHEKISVKDMIELAAGDNDRNCTFYFKGMKIECNYSNKITFKIDGKRTKRYDVETILM